MNIPSEVIYKIQLPNYSVNADGYTIADEYLAALDEEGSMVMFPASQVSPGEVVRAVDIFVLQDRSNDPIIGPHKLVSKTVLDTEELVDVCKQCIGATIEVRRGGMVFRRFAIEVGSENLYVIDLSCNDEQAMSYDQFLEEYGDRGWKIEDIIR